jgi:hypothetical protein
MFTPQLADYRPPMYGGVAPRPYQAFDFSSMLGEGSAAAAGSMFLQPLLAQLMGGQGMTPGQFQPNRNFVDHIQAQQFFMQQQQAMATGAAMDRMQQQRILAGSFQMMGIPVGVQQQRFIDQATAQWQVVAPIFASAAPDMYDQWHGPIGGAANLAKQVHLGGRHLIDPLTGQYGMRGQSAGNLAGAVFNELYAPGRDLTRMNGLGAGRAGELFEELARRGYIGSLTRGETLQGLQKDMGFGTQQEMLQHFGRLGGVGAGAAMETPEMQKAMQTFDARRAASKIREMSGAVAAMRDIFGDMGVTNAPMSKLIDGLNQLTQGGLSTMGGAQLEMTARRLGNLARTSGMGMEVLSSVLMEGSGVADRMGVSRQFVPSATLGAGAFGQAYRTVGGANIPAFGRMDAEGMTLLDQRLRLGAMGSGMGNMLGAGARMVAEGMAAPGSDLHKMMQAVQNNQRTFTDSRGNTVDLAAVANNPQMFIDLAKASGVSASTIGQLLSDSHGNQGYSSRPATNIMNFVRGLSGAAEIDPMLMSAATSGIKGVLAGQGFGQDDINARSPAMAAALTSALRGMSVADRASPRRNAILSKVLRAQLGEAGYARLGSTNAERDAKLNQMIGGMNSGAGELAILSGYDSLEAMLDAHDPRTLAAAAAFDADNTFHATS